MALAVLAYLVHRDRGRLKGAVLAAVLGGASRDEIAALTRAFVASTRTRRLRASALAAIERHRVAGDRLVLLSASPDLYVPALGAELGFAEVICTEVRWQGSRLDGHLVSDNRRGEEKARVVTALLQRYPGPSSAYGNAASDLLHLALVARPLLVNGDATARAKASALGIPTADWPCSPPRPSAKS